MKKTKKKYQIGGNTKMTDAEAEKIRQQLAEWDKANGITDSSVPQQHSDPFYGSALSQNSPQVNPPVKGLTDTNQELVGDGTRDFSQGFKALNAAALGVTAIANSYNTIRNDRKNRRQYIDALQNPASVNFNEDGLNKIPAYYKAGGMNKKYSMKKQMGGTSITPQHMKDWNAFTQYAKQKGYSNNPDLDIKTKNVGEQYLNEYRKINPTTSIDYNMVQPIQQSLQDYRNSSLANIKAGRGSFAPGTNENNYLSRLSKVDNWLGTNTINSQFPSAYIDSFQNGQFQNRKNLGFASTAKLQMGGDPNEGNPAELEQGEVFQDGDGQINKISDQAPTHEQGGVDVPNVQRVLEDTSTDRKDKASKLLKLIPTAVKGMLGFKPKQSVSHADAHDKAVDFYNKKSTAIINKVALNAESRRTNDHDMYALNSIKFNAIALKELPKEQELFDTLFQHQEGVKAAFGISDAGKKMQTGGYSFQPYAGDKNWKGNASKHTKEEWDAMATDLGFEGGNTKEFQQFLINQQGDVNDNGTTQPNFQPLIGGLHSQFGNPKAPPSGKYVDNWLDGRLGHRWDATFDAWKLSKSNPSPNIQLPALTLNTPTEQNAPVESLQPNTAPQAPTPLLQTGRVDNRFKSPLKWYDVAGELSGIASDTEAPVNYNPAELHKLQLKLQNPLPTLQQGQADYNAGIKAIQGTGASSGVQLGNMADLFAKKYAFNNQVLGQYENANVGVKNQETQYNTQVADRQSGLDQQARDAFEQKVLGGKEAVRQQKREDWGSLFSKIAQNAKFNKEGNLLMKLFPAFTQTGDYDGYQHKFHSPVGGGSTDINSYLISKNIDISKMTERQKAQTYSQLQRLDIKMGKK